MDAAVNPIVLSYVELVACDNYPVEATHKAIGSRDDRASREDTANRAGHGCARRETLS